jgi:hypothetical protein
MEQLTWKERKKLLIYLHQNFYQGGFLIMLYLTALSVAQTK